MPTNTFATVRRAIAGLVNGADAAPTVDPTGALVVLDFYAKAIIDGYGYQLRAGTITTPLTGAVAISDTAAEFCADVINGGTLIPLELQISVRAGTGTAHEMALKSVNTVSSAGTAFVPLPLKRGGAAASLTSARVQAAGNVTVTAELATTTVRHWEYAQQAVFTTGQVIIPKYEPLRPPLLQGAAASGQSLYAQIAAATTGPSYYAHMNWLEIPTALLGTG